MCHIILLFTLTWVCIFRHFVLTLLYRFLFVCMSLFSLWEHLPIAAFKNAIEHYLPTSKPWRHYLIHQLWTVHIVTTCAGIVFVIVLVRSVVLLLGITWWLRLHGSKSLRSVNLRRRRTGKPEHRAVNESAGFDRHRPHTYPCQESGTSV